MSKSSVRLVLAGPGRRIDLAVPVDATVREVLTSTGIDPARTGVMSAGGDLVDPDQLVGDGMRDGALLWLFDGSAAAASARAAEAARRHARAAPPRPGVIAAVVVTVAAAVTASALLDASGIGAPVAAVVLGAATLALLARRGGDAAHADVAALLAPAVAFASGAAAGAATGFPAAVLAIAGIAAAATACVRHGLARLRDESVQAVTGVSAGMWVLAAAVVATVFVTGLPALIAPAILLAVAPPLFRALTSIAAAVDDEDLLDMPYLIRDAQGVRTSPPRDPRPVRRGAVERSFADAWRRCDAAAVLLAGITAASAVALMLLTPADSVAGWCLVAGTAGAGAFLVLAARTLRVGLTRTAARTAGLVAMVAAGARALPALPVAPLAAALAVLLAGAAVALVILPTSRGWRALGWSRTGDIVEGTLIALSPAALLFGSGLVDELMKGIG